MRDDDLCKILELLLWHRLLTHACHHLGTAYNTDGIKKGHNYHILTCCQKVNWYSHLSKFIHGELAVFIPGWNKDERWIVQLSNTTPCIGKYEVTKNVHLSNCLNASRSSFLLWLGPLFRLRATIWRKCNGHGHWGWFLTLLAAWQLSYFDKFVELKWIVLFIIRHLPHHLQDLVFCGIQFSALTCILFILLFCLRVSSPSPWRF